MKNIWIFIIPLLGLVACDNTDTTADKVENKMEEVADKISEETQNTWNALESEWESVDGQIAAELENLEDKIENATGDAKSELELEKEQLEAWQEELGDRFESGIEKAGDNWGNFVGSTKKRMNEIRKSLKEDS